MSLMNHPLSKCSFGRSRFDSGYGAFSFSFSRSICSDNSGVLSLDGCGGSTRDACLVAPCSHPVASPAAHCQPHNQGDSASSSE